MPMRRNDWHSRLTTYLAATAQEPFRAGKHDCMMFAAGAVKAMTGRDLARGWRGYRSLAAGRAKLREAGFADHVALVRSLLSETTVPRPGDIAVIQTPDGPGMGIVQGQAVYAVAAIGWVLVPVSDAVAFFEVL